MSHRILAINRGEKEDFLKVDISVPEEKIHSFLFDSYNVTNTNKRKHMVAAIIDAYKRLIQPSVEREIRNELTES